MDTESKGRAWFGNIYRKLETVLLEIDKCASQSRIRYVDGHKAGVVSTSLSSNVGHRMLSPESSGSPASTFASDKPEEVTESNSSDSVDMQQDQDFPALLSSKSPSDSASDKKFENLEKEHSDERIEGNGVIDRSSDPILAAEESRSRAPLLEEYVDYDQTVATSLGHTELIPLQDTDRGSNDSQITDDSNSKTFSCSDPSVLPCKERVEGVGVKLCRSTVATESQVRESFPESFGTEVACNGSTAVCSSGYFLGDSNQLPPAPLVPAVTDEGNMEKRRPSGSNSITLIGNQDDFHDDEDGLDLTSLETIELYDMTNREDHSDLDDGLLYAVRQRTRKLRSFKRKILDALGSKRKLEKDYEQLAVWFGDAYMGSDLDTPKLLFPSKAVTAVDSKSWQSPLTSEEDSEWELVDKPHIH